MSENTTAERFTERLMEHRSEEQKEQYRKYFKLGEGEEFVGVRMGRVFELAKECIEILPDEIIDSYSKALSTKCALAD